MAAGPKIPTAPDKYLLISAPHALENALLKHFFLLISQAFSFFFRFNGRSIIPIHIFVIFIHTNYLDND